MNEFLTPAAKALKIIPALLLCAWPSAAVSAVRPEAIVVKTNGVALAFTVQENGKLYQAYLGVPLADPKDYLRIRQDTKHWRVRNEAYIPSGTNNLFEPAIRMIHADGNPSLDLRYKEHSTKREGDATVTRIVLTDPKYPVEVTLVFTAWEKEDVIGSRVEVLHHEDKPVVLTQAASSMLHFDAPPYWLTQFHGKNMGEMKMVDTQLTSGIKVIDSKLLTRSQMFQTPVFLLSLVRPSGENDGEVVAGTLAWSGNFRFLFEVDEMNALRVISGLNPFGSEYYLEPGELFVTPEFLFTYSNTGRGPASRNFHRWAAAHGVLDADRPHMTLLNNWEATFFKFDQEKLDSLIRDASKLGWNFSCSTMDGSATNTRATTTRRDWATGRRTKRNCPAASPIWWRRRGKMG